MSAWIGNSWIGEIEHLSKRQREVLDDLMEGALIQSCKGGSMVVWPQCTPGGKWGGYLIHPVTLDALMERCVVERFEIEPGDVAYRISSSLVERN